MKWVVGIDEVGRGPLAGPVTVCAVAIDALYFKKIPQTYERVILTDSKKMTPRGRATWQLWAKQKQQEGVLRFVSIHVSAKEIDRIGIGNAINQALTKALSLLTIEPEHSTVYLDGGLRAPSLYKKQQTIIKGDLHHRAISLASVIAKVARDTLMVRYNKMYPGYGFDQHKGYGTLFHRKVIQEKGISPIHRKSFLTRILDKK